MSDGALEAATEPEAAAAVALDAQVIIEGNYNFKSARLTSLSQLAASGVIEFVITDLTVREIRANLRAAVTAAVAQKAAAPVLRNSKAADVIALFKKLDGRAIQKELLAQFDAFLKESNAQIVEVTPSVLPAVLDAYFERRAPFGPGKDKAEFPDALTLEALTRWCDENACELAFVSKDGAFRQACVNAEALQHFEDLGKYLDALLRSVHGNDARSAFVRGMINQQSDVIAKLAEKEFGNHGAYLANQDGEVTEITMNGLVFGDMEDVELISLDENSAVVELDVMAQFTASITYKRQGTGTYDSEDKVMLFQDEVEESVDDEHDTRLAVEVTFKDIDPQSFKIVKVSFEGEDTIAVYADDD